MKTITPSLLRWHRLSELTDENGIIELMAASCVDGVGVIAFWERDEFGFEVTAMNTEGCVWEAVDFDDEANEIPRKPPTDFDDLPSQ